jgi:hypothetical protein
MAKKFKQAYITEEMRAVTLLSILQDIVNRDADAIVTIRQTEGTDFPPFIAIESESVHDATDKEHVFANLLTY